jgi:hypothetical protein
MKRTTEQIVVDIINKAGGKATRRQIERWYQEREDLGDVLATLLEQGKITYSKGAYHVRIVR